ncbi:uncharacterized protein JCM6883_001801 [Sporobolomyces salmoneus]|uniref:uncharacterized protein n=1 Tax=Sporobolomyces salmoneus TaxID=183962 RepID=UPI0031829F9B
MPCLFRLPVNADTTLVALCRPITFLSALTFAFVAFLYSSFLNISGLAPIECRCSTADKTPRIRPRPPPAHPISASPPSSPALATKTSSPLESFSSFSSFVADSFRPRRPPPVARRGSHKKSLPYPVHELDEVLEEEDVEGTEIRASIDSEEGEDPGLTPDVSEGEDTSSVGTMDDVRVETSKKAKGSKGFFSLKWKKQSSEDSSASPSGIDTPSNESKHPLPTSTSNSEAPHVSPPKSAFRTSRVRPRSATSSSTYTRSVHFNPHRQTSLDSASSIETMEHAGGGVLRSRKPLSINTSTPSQPRSLFNKPSFRSLSPLSRSPVTTPEPSPPTSPRLGSNSAGCLVAKHLATRLSRSHSLDSHSSGSRSRRNRSASPLPEQSIPRLRRGVSATEGLGIDSSGSSDLKLDDLLQ